MEEELDNVTENLSEEQDPELTAEECKLKGNEFFKRKDYK